ncbi:MAG: histidine phosphatase family protein [bacterium]
MKKLKNLIILRHGPFEGRGFLTTEGKAHVSERARQLKKLCGLDPAATTIVCSRELRTLMTAQCMISVLGLEELRGCCHQQFFSNDVMCDTSGAIEVIKRYGENYENLIVVTHSEMAATLPHVFCLDVISLTDTMFRSVGYGQGFVINLEKRICEFVN